MIEEEEEVESKTSLVTEDGKKNHTASTSSGTTSCSSTNSSLEQLKKHKDKRSRVKELSEIDTMSSDKEKTIGSVSSNEGLHIRGTPVNTIDREMKALDQQMADLALECQQLESQSRFAYKVGNSGDLVSSSHSEHLMANSNKNLGNSIAIRKETRPTMRPAMTLPSFNGTESDHIYESIPDITESDEPIYCLPYEPGKTGRRISPKQQLFIVSHRGVTDPNTTEHQQQPGTHGSNKSSSSSGGSRGSSGRRKESFRDSNNKKGSSFEKDGARDRRNSIEQWVEQNTTLAQECNCKNENRDSSSAYNTGDSTGSNHQVYCV